MESAQGAGADDSSVGAADSDAADAADAAGEASTGRTITDPTASVLDSRTEMGDIGQQ